MIETHENQPLKLRWKKNRIPCKTFTWTCAILIFQNQLLLSIVIYVNFKTVLNLFAYENEEDERKKRHQILPMDQCTKRLWMNFFFFIKIGESTFCFETCNDKTAKIFSADLYLRRKRMQFKERMNEISRIFFNASLLLLLVFS